MELDRQLDVAHLWILNVRAVAAPAAAALARLAKDSHDLSIPTAQLEQAETLAEALQNALDSTPPPLTTYSALVEYTRELQVAVQAACEVLDVLSRDAHIGVQSVAVLKERLPNGQWSRVGDMVDDLREVLTRKEVSSESTPEKQTVLEGLFRDFRKLQRRYRWLEAEFRAFYASITHALDNIALEDALRDVAAALRAHPRPGLQAWDGSAVSFWAAIERCKEQQRHGGRASCAVRRVGSGARSTGRMTKMDEMDLIELSDEELDALHDRVGHEKHRRSVIRYRKRSLETSGTADWDFELRLDSDPTGDEAMNRLYAQGCNDATFGMRDGVGYGAFVRSGATLAAAMKSAIAAVERAGFKVISTRSAYTDQP